MRSMIDYDKGHKNTCGSKTEKIYISWESVACEENHKHVLIAHSLGMIHELLQLGVCFCLQKYHALSPQLHW